MAARKPLVLVNGEAQQLQSADYISGDLLIRMGGSTTTLTSGAGYVFASPASALRTAFGLTGIHIPYSGTITRIVLFTSSASGGTTGQTINWYKNGISQGAITTSWSNASGAVRLLNITGLNLSVSDGDYIEFQFSAGANATSCTIDGSIILRT